MPANWITSPRNFALQPFFSFALSLPLLFPLLLSIESLNLRFVFTRRLRKSMDCTKGCKRRSKNELCYGDPVSESKKKSFRYSIWTLVYAFEEGRGRGLLLFRGDIPTVRFNIENQLVGPNYGIYTRRKFVNRFNSLQRERQRTV